MKTSAVIRILIYILVAVLCISLLIIGLIKGSLGKFSGFRVDFLKKDTWGSLNGYTIASSGEIDSGTLNSINIDWINGSVTLQVYDGDLVTFTEKNDSNDADYQMRYKCSGGKLDIRFSRSGNLGLGIFDLPEKILTVQIPRELMLDSISINAVSSDVKLTGISAKELQLETVSGKITGIRLSSETLEAHTVSGGIDLSGIKAYSVDLESVSGSQSVNVGCMQFRAETASGKVNAVFDDTVKNIKIDTISGDMTVYLDENTGFRVDWDSISGGFSSDFQVTGGKGNASYGSGVVSIHFGTVSGRMQVLHT